MRFSICIPNYNYERFLGRTIASVLSQDHADFEILVSDNASTDGSVALVNSIDDPRIKLRVNRRNVGFAANLDCAASMATGDYLIMLSSDDIIRPGALSAYARILERLTAEERSSVILTSTWDVIDPEDVVTGRTGPHPAVWHPGDRRPELEATVGGPVYSVDGPQLLRRCLASMRNPFNFAATAYTRTLHEEVCGYGGGRLINPDKWFHWRVLSVARRALYIDVPFFAYRWHPNNQAAQEASTGALKYLVDEYRNTLELDKQMLGSSGLSRDEVVGAFVRHDIVRHGLATLAKGDRLKAARIMRFGRSVYPQEMLRQRESWALAGLLALGPVGRRIASAAYRHRVGDTEG